MAKTKKATAVAAVDAVPPTRQQARLMEIAPGDLRPWPGLNPRTHFDEVALNELAASLKKSGVLEPILVHRRDGDDFSTGEIVAGERRWRAAVIAGLATVPCLVWEFTEEEALEVAIVENAQRSDLSPIEEARGFRTWLAGAGGRKVQDLADRIGKSQPFVSNRLRLLELPVEILDLVEEDLLPVGLARDLLLPFAKIPEAKRVKLFDGFAKWLRGQKEAPTPDEVEDEIGTRAAQLSRTLSATSQVYGTDTVLPIFDAAAHKSCTCGGPKFPYGYQPSVRCFDEVWWDARQAEAAAARKAEEEERVKKLAEPVIGAVVMKHEEFGRQYAYGQYESIDRPKQVNAYGRTQLLDPVQLADARMVLVTDGYNAGLKCLDVDAVKRAKSAATRERNRRLKERRDARAARYRAEAATVGIEPWMLGVILSERPQNDQVLDVSREMGIDVGKHGELNDNLKKLPDPDVELLFKTLALRSRNGELGWIDPIEKEVDAELLEEYGPGLSALEKRVREAAAGTEKKPRAGKAKKVPAGEIETPRQQLDLRFEHVREAIAAVEAAGGAVALAGVPDAEGNPLSTLARRVMSLQDYIAEHNAAPMHEAEDGNLTYSMNQFGVLAEAEAMLGAAREEEDAVARCRVCGCTEERACPGGCSWVADPAGLGDLCSNPHCMEVAAREAEEAEVSHA